jgi:hypothetical protein
VYVRNSVSRRLLAQIPKAFLSELMRDYVASDLRAGTLPRAGSDIIDIAIQRHRMAENRRIRANIRYERNHVATRRHEAAIARALAERWRFRRKAENAADELNRQLSSPARQRDSLFVYDYRDRRMVLYEWRGGLPVPVINWSERKRPKRQK